MHSTIINAISYSLRVRPGKKLAEKDEVTDPSFSLTLSPALLKLGCAFLLSPAVS